ncbi:DNA helicase [Exophiala dermatitidis]|uniref:ATP-dependent DNA helicase PIF1 n=1 Tax=Exophiala dermatitidis TaxID=5970 RepID=A0AAN6ISD2_EXODE|nr:DNA helicase [Exophiala dermatitidis]
MPPILFPSPLRLSIRNQVSSAGLITVAMFAQAVRRHASTGHGEKKQSPLQINTAASNIPGQRSQTTSGFKRKFERSISTTSGLGSLHSQTSFDENTPPGPSDIAYPTLPPLPQKAEPPSSSAPVPWSSSPESHFAKPGTTTLLKGEPSPERARPTKRRVLPASFTSTSAPALDEQDGAKNIQGGGVGNGYSGRFDKYSAQRQFDSMSSRDKASSAMSEMLQKASSIRQRQPGSISRTASDRTFQPATIPREGSAPSVDRLPEVFFSDEQQTVLKAVIEEGKSVFFTGSAGTGKSVLMRAIISQMKHKYRKEPDRIAVTASTGLASCILEGQTLHSWAGIGLGKEPAPELVKKIKRNQKSRQKWLRTKVLIIDEISMVDGQLFDKLEQVARTIRNNGRPFGGIQLVVTGDFFQLPPVPEKNSVAKFVFDATTWNTCIGHTILLTHVFRQKDERFAQMLNEMRLGKMSAATVREFKSLSRPLNFHDELEATELYPRREEVEFANQNRMRKLSGQVMTYHAVDTGVQDPNVRKALLANFIAPEVLELKKGAQVMLIKNIDSQLVNGSLGIVQSFMDEGTFFAYKEDEPSFLLAQEPDNGDLSDEKMAAREKLQAARMKSAAAGAGATRLWPMVRFNLPDGTSRTMLCSPDEWKTESQQGEVLAKRVQVPLILAWALSIHKAQGQTLTRVKVDLGKVFEKGQAYVALSRARSKEGLQVLRFDERKVMVHPKVLEFYSKLSGHETLGMKSTAKTVKDHFEVKSNTAIQKETKTITIEEDDFLDDDFSFEELMEAEKQAMRARGA